MAIGQSEGGNSSSEDPSSKVTLVNAKLSKLPITFSYGLGDLSLVYF